MDIGQAGQHMGTVPAMLEHVFEVNKLFQITIYPIVEGVRFMILAVSKSTRQCNNPSPANGGRYCLGNFEKFKMCNSADDKTNDCENDLSATVEKNCQNASLANPALLPFGDAQETSDCQIKCFKAGPEGGTLGVGSRYPDGTQCKDKDHFCIKGKCEVKYL